MASVQKIVLNLWFDGQAEQAAELFHRDQRRAAAPDHRGGVVPGQLPDQAEIDHYWDALMAGGGQPGPCGWLKDRFGLSWQVVPEGMDELFSDPDPGRAMQAMFSMTKLDIAELRRAADAVPTA